MATEFIESKKYNQKVNMTKTPESNSKVANPPASWHFVYICITITVHWAKNTEVNRKKTQTSKD